MADITLNSAVRSNLRTMQSTTDLLNRTEERLSTGKKVNSALDNPSSFFTAQSLDRRASDLNGLLDTISSSVKTIEAADNGITAISDLVSQLKSTARSAQQSTSAVTEKASFTSSAIAGATAANLLGGTAQVGTAQVGTAQVGTAQVGTAQVGTAQVGTAQVGTAATATTLNGASGTFGTYTGGDIEIDGETITIAADSDLAAVQAAIDAELGAGYTVGSNSGQLTISKADGTDIAVTGDSTLLDAIGFQTGNRTSTNGTEASANYQPASSNYQPASSNYAPASSDYQPASADYQPASSNYAPASADYQAATPALSGTLTVAVGGGAEKTITFGTGAGQVKSLDDLNEALSSVGAKASLSSNGALTIETSNEFGSQSLKIGGSLVEATSAAAGAGQIFDLTATTTTDTAVTGGDGKSRRTDFVNDYNDLRDQIAKLAKDASYNGVNLLNGDDLSVVFNEDGSSKLDVNGVDLVDALGLSDVTFADFADSSKIEEVVSKLNDALSSLDSLSSKFGSQLSVVEIRQSFTKDMIGTLEDGALALVGADTNEEAANIATLQTRQSLIVSSLSISTQQESNVLQLLR